VFLGVHAWLWLGRGCLRVELCFFATAVCQKLTKNSKLPVCSDTIRHLLSYRYAQDTGVASRPRASTLIAPCARARAFTVIVDSHQVRTANPDRGSQKVFRHRDRDTAIGAGGASLSIFGRLFMAASSSTTREAHQQGSGGDGSTCYQASAVRRRRSGGGGGRCRARCWPADIRRWLAGFCCVTAAFSLSAVMLGRRKLLLVVMLLLTLHLQSPDKRTREKSLKQNKMIKNDAESRNGLSKLSRNPPRSYFPI